MQEELSGKIDIGIVGVNLAGVCGDQWLGDPIGLRRLDLVLNAWRTQISRYAEFRFFADRFLLRDLGREDRRRAKRMRRAGELEVGGNVDDSLLSDAEKHGGCVLAKERPLDAKRGLSAAPAQDFTWAVGDKGVRIARRAPYAQPVDTSHLAVPEPTDIHSLPDLRDAAVRNRWRCVSKAPCLTRELSPDFLRVLPRIEGDQILCPGCWRPLRPIDQRPNEAELRVLIDDDTVARFTVGPADEVTFGKLALPDTAELAELDRKGAFSGVGRVHAQLRMDGDRVAVRPVDDDHPVAVRRWNPRRRRLGRERELRHGDGFTPLELRDALVIGKRLELVRSHRSITEAEELRRGDDAYWRLHTTGRQ